MDDDQASKENQETPSNKDFNKLDLSQLQGFSFGTQWTQDKSSPSRGGHDSRQRRDEGGGDHHHRQSPGGEARRDRRNFRKPAPSISGDAPSTTGENAPAGDNPPRHGANERTGRAYGARSPGRDFHGGQRRDDHRDFRNAPRRDIPEGPYLSPYFNVTFYAEDTGFTALIKAVRNSFRTYELFEIARVIIGKNDRFVAAIQRKQPNAAPFGQRFQRNQKPAGPADEAAADSENTETPAPAKPTVKLPPIAISVPDGIPFDNEESVIAHVLSKHLGQFFDTAEVEVEPPKGNYQVINKCGLTGELLAPPNYHRYNQIVQQHYTTRISRMGFEAFRERIETIRDPEVVKQWLDKMKKTTRYTWKLTPPAEGAVAPAFDTLDEARSYLLTTARDKVVRTAEGTRVHGKLIENMPPGEIRRAIEGTLERQRRFPLDTANALRGRLRREGFTIFKRGSKGISYVCAVKRKFRVPGQTFADSIGALIAFIEANPMIKASELPAKFLNIIPPAAPATPAAASAQPAAAESQSDSPPTQSQPAEKAAPASAEQTTASQTTPPIAPATSGSVAPFAATATTLTAEDHAKLHRLTGDLRWLVSEGYVTEYNDGRLFAPPVMTEARKREVENEEQELEGENLTETSAPAAPATASTSAPETTAEPEPVSEPAPAPEQTPDNPEATDSATTGV